jgi:hypothetical protein
LPERDQPTREGGTMKSVRAFGLVLLSLALLLGSTSCATSEVSPPTSPTNLAKTTPDNDNTPTFTWNAATDDDSGVDYYLVNIDGGGVGGLWTNVGDVTTYTLNSALSDGSHTFNVEAVDKAGNEGTFVSLDFTCDANAPVISAVGSSGITNTSATVMWTTHEPSTSQVEYGVGSEYGSATALEATLVSSHIVTITGLETDTVYHFRVRSKDSCGNEATSVFYTFATPDTIAPTISSVAVSGTTAHGATITWVTNEPSTSQVDYGQTAACELSTVLNVGFPYNHSVVLSGLSGETTYYLRVRSTDASGNEARSVVFTFATAKCPVLPNWIDSYYACYGELPLIPTWMAPLIAGYSAGMRVHQGITVGVPSIQFWNGLLPSQQEQVLQLIDWLGQNREDWLWLMRAMIPGR